MEEPNALMRWIMFHFAGGDALFVALLAGAIISIWPGTNRSPWRGTLVTLMTVVWGALSSPAWPLWGMLAILGIVIAWRFSVHATSDKSSVRQRLAILFRAALVIAGLAEISTYGRSAPAIPQRLDVIADSITAGLNDGEITWPRLYAERTGISVRDASQPGATLKSALKQAELLDDDNPLVLEIGGNDLLSGLPVNQFAEHCESLLKKLCTPDRAVWMVELPLPPLCSRYGEAQRRLCRRYGVRLIPKRPFMSLLTTKGATVDSIHLAPLGQELLCETVLHATGNSLQPGTATFTYEKVERRRN